MEAATAKVCPQCSTPLKPTATPGSWCQSCAFPPCAVCHKVNRPHKGPYHAKHKPIWVCPACTVCPQCHKCLKAGSQPGTWCQSCAYPPCAGCQQVARPGGNHAYHAKHRPFWRCDKCAQASCPMCQANPLGQDAGGGPDAACPQCAEHGPKCAVCKQPMVGRPHSHGWCHGCAFPPCAAGCGRPRPSGIGAQHAEYHAKHMPQWTCQPCQLSQNEPAKRRRLQPAQQTPCHRCRHRRNRLMTVPVRRLPLANPSEEKRKARPPARRRVPRQRRPHPRFGQLTRAPCRSHPMTAQFPGLQFCCVNHGKGNEASPAPTWRAPCRHLSQRPCCPTPNPKAFAYRSYPK